MFRIFNERAGNLRNRAKQSNNNAPHEGRNVAFRTQSKAEGDCGRM